MKIPFLLFALFPLALLAQQQTNVTQLSPKDAYDNLFIQNLSSDTNITSDVLWIKKEVKPHKHSSHSECVYFLEGNGKMLIGDKTYDAKAGDYFYVPVNVVHALRVTSGNPVKVIAIHAPKFDGKDRVPIEMQW